MKRHKMKVVVIESRDFVSSIVVGYDWTVLTTAISLRERFPIGTRFGKSQLYPDESVRAFFCRDDMVPMPTVTDRVAQLEHHRENELKALTLLQAADARRDQIELLGG